MVTGLSLAAGFGAILYIEAFSLVKRPFIIQREQREQRLSSKPGIVSPGEDITRYASAGCMHVPFVGICISSNFFSLPDLDRDILTSL